MSRKSYADAFWNGHHAARKWFSLRPFWRGKKYLKAWDNGYRRGKYHFCECEIYPSGRIHRTLQCLFDAIVQFRVAEILRETK